MQNAASYEKLMERVERADFIAAIRQGLQDVEEGKVHDALEQLEKLAATLEIRR